MGAEAESKKLRGLSKGEGKRLQLGFEMQGDAEGHLEPQKGWGTGVS